MLSRWIRRFRAKDDGAVTVDWVVLTAALIGLCIAAYNVIRASSYDLAHALGNRMITETENGDNIEPDGDFTQ